MEGCRFDLGGWRFDGQLGVVAVSKETRSVHASVDTTMNNNVSHVGSLLLATLVLSIQLGVLSVALSQRSLSDSVRLGLVVLQLPLIPVSSFLGYKAFRSKYAASVFSTASVVVTFSCFLFFSS